MPPAPSSSSVVSRVTAFPWEPSSAFCGIGPPDSFGSGPPTPLCRPIFLFRPFFVQESDGFLPHIWGPVLEASTVKGLKEAQLSSAASP
eukprot:4785326-Pleurochrysis_carterae.AAC.1